MLSLQRLLKVGYVLALGSAVLVLSRPAPVRAQRTIAYAFLPGQAALTAARAQLLATAATPMVSYNRAQQMLMLAGQPAGMAVGGGTGISGGQGIAGGATGIGGGAVGIVGMGGGMGMGGGIAGNRGGMGGGLGGGMGMGGMPGGFGGGIAGGLGGVGGLGGFAGKGFGGFNGKKPL